MKNSITEGIAASLALLLMPLAFVFMFLNSVGGIVAVVWIMIEGQWSILFLSGGFVFFGHWILGFGLLISMIFAYPGIKASESGSSIVASVLMLLTSITRVTILSLWVYAVFQVFHSKLPEEKILTCLIIYYSSTTAVVFLAVKNSNDPNDPSKLVAMFTQIGCMISLVTWYFMPDKNYFLFVFPVFQLIGELLLAKDLGLLKDESAF